MMVLNQQNTDPFLRKLYPQPALNSCTLTGAYFDQLSHSLFQEARERTSLYERSTLSSKRRTLYRRVYMFEIVYIIPCTDCAIHLVLVRQSHPSRGFVNILLMNLVIFIQVVAPPQCNSTTSF